MIPFLPLSENFKKWGFLLPENREFIKIPFHVFDRYEIHIQAFIHFINGKSITFQSSSPQKYVEKMYSFVHTPKNETINLKKTKNRVPRTYIFRKKSNFCEVQIVKHNIFPRWFHIFLAFLKHFGNSLEVSGSRFWPNVRSSRNQLKSIGIDRESLISHFGII